MIWGVGWEWEEDLLSSIPGEGCNEELTQTSKNIVIIFRGLCESLNPSIALKTALSGQF